MRKLTDEEIQKIVEDSLLHQNLSDISEESHRELKMYSLLFEELKPQPLNALPEDFADKVIHKINGRKALEDTLKYYGLILLLILLFMSVTVGIFIYTEVTYLNDVLALMDKFKGSIIFGVTCLLLIQFFDQLLVKNKVGRFNH